MDQSYAIQEICRFHHSFSKAQSQTRRSSIMVARTLLRSAGALRQLARRGGGLQHQRRALTTAGEAAASTGPPFKKFFWITTGVMFGIPGAIGAVFVYNLKSDDEFYNHFNDRYPDLIAAINEYAPLNEAQQELASREDIGPVESAEELLTETVTVVAELQSRQKVRFQVLGSASQQEIEALALKQSEQPETDRVVAITFAEDGDAEEDTAAVPALTTQGAWPPQPRVTWGSAAQAQEKAKKPANSTKELRLQIEEISAQQAALEASKYTGRDIDEADEEIAALEERKVALTAQLPRKRFLYIF
ncbi:hypothetical protein BBJ28_00012308 [Nothophytophthora sp. Chile5]|nr:hypothetical protein BBJ28_00012308 [Nothophytophthora sp. Chile5]